MPCAYLPFDAESGEPWFTDEELGAVRLSSKSHWDVPIEIDHEVVHFLAAHPTPPVFDGPENRNGKRNFDEIRFWADYISENKKDSSYIYDDHGSYGGIAGGAKGKVKGESSAKFVIAGDYNADPFDGDSFNRAAVQFTENPLINNEVTPSAFGGAEQAFRQGSNNLEHCGSAVYDTADFGEAQFGGPGNVRVDYGTLLSRLYLVPRLPSSYPPRFLYRQSFRPQIWILWMPESSGLLKRIPISSSLVSFHSRRPITRWCGWTLFSKMLKCAFYVPL
jgi:hypothetical protein